MESAVLERPLEAEDEAWAKQMGAAGITESNGPPDGTDTLSIALAAPDEFGDLWPGHCYLPPKIKQLRKLIPLTQSIFEKLGQDDAVLEAFDDAVQFVRLLARREDSFGELHELTVDEIEERFDETEIAQLINHIMLKQGLTVENHRGNAESGSPVGYKNFRRSVATTQATDLSIVGN